MKTTVRISNRKRKTNMVLEREIALKMVELFLLGEGKRGESYLL